MEKVSEERLAELIEEQNEAFATHAIVRWKEEALDLAGALRELRDLRARHKEAVSLLKETSEYGGGMEYDDWRNLVQGIDTFLAKEQSDG